MKILHKLASVVCTTGILLFASAASATPVQFSIASVAFSTPGGGYGQDSSENGGTLLDVRFSTSTFAPQIFSLSGAGDFTTFTFGTIGLYEKDLNGGLIGNEQGGLNVTAAFTFVTPVGTAQTLFTTGIATVGKISDSDVDYTINWDPILVAFGSGGQFEIDLNDLGFTANGLANGEGEVQTLTAKITLKREAGTPNGTPIPEPSTVALFGLGLLGAAFSRRKSGAVSA
jgi:hypothetical protein